MPAATQVLGMNPITRGKHPGLKPNILKPESAITNFYMSPLLSQRLAFLNKTVAVRSQVIVVTGEQGSGKTSLMKQFLSGSDLPWRLSRIRLKPSHRFSSRLLGGLDNRKIFMARGKCKPSVIIDDAHHLHPRALSALLQWAFSHESGPRLQSLVLLADTHMRRRYSEIAKCLPDNAVIDKIHMTPLSEEQTAAYLQHCMQLRGYAAADLFSADQINGIHRKALGWPGSINRETNRLLRQLKGAPDKGSFFRSCAQALFGVKNFYTKRFALNI